MTTFAGNHAGSIVHAESARVSTNLGSDDGVQVLDAFLMAECADDGAMTDNLPIAMPEVVSEGYRGFSGAGSDHWYYGFHIIPSAIDVGNVLNDFTQTFTIWNAWLDDKTLLSVSGTGSTEGIALTPDDAPFAFPGLEEREYTLDVSVNGASIIDVIYEFAFSSGEIINLPVTGQRIFAWTFRPDWSREIEERMEWATDVMTAYDGTEQRFKLRANPRRTLVYSFTIENNRDRRKFEAMLFNWGARVWLVPFWMEGNGLGAVLPAASESITLDRLDGNWQVGGYAIIFSEAFSFEIIKVSNIAGNTITFNSPTTQEWPASAVIYPAVTGLLNQRQALSRFTGQTEYGLCEFSIYETETVAAPSEYTYRGIPVMTDPPYWMRDITHDFVRKLQEIDYRLGKFSFEDEAGMPFNIISHQWVADGKDEIDALRQFMYARAGKHKAVWLPTFAPDIELVENVGMASLYLDVAHGFILKHLWGHDNRKDIFIELQDGTKFFRRIDDVEELDANTERLTIDSPLGIDITPADVLRISWLNCARFDSDSISFVWRHDDWVEAAVNWRTTREPEALEPPPI